MKKMTSAYANKVLRKLGEDKDFWREKEQEGYLYVAALDEEPVIPDYNYEEVAKNKGNSCGMTNSALWILLITFFALILGAILTPVIITSARKRR